MRKKIIGAIDVAMALYLMACILGLVALTAYTGALMLFAVGYAAGGTLIEGIKNLRS